LGGIERDMRASCIVQRQRDGIGTGIDEEANRLVIDIGDGEEVPAGTACDPGRDGHLGGGRRCHDSDRGRSRSRKRKANANACKNDKAKRDFHDGLIARGSLGSG
jgi:hypothetical protein